MDKQFLARRSLLQLCLLGTLATTATIVSGCAQSPEGNPSRRRRYGGSNSGEKSGDGGGGGRN